jgi:hypothetical protein
VADDRRPKHRDHGYPRPPSISSGIPPEIDPELTPLPAAPPGPEAFSVLPMAAKVAALHHVQQEHAAGFERIWEVRHLGTEIKAQTQRLERLETIVAQDTRQVTELIAKVQIWGQMSKEAWDKSDALSAKQIRLDERLAVFFDEQFPDLVSEIKALGRLSTRIADVESEAQDIKAKLVEHEEALATLDKRVAKFERADTEQAIRVDERRRWFAIVLKFPKTATAIIAAAVAIAGYLGITHL